MMEKKGKSSDRDLDFDENKSTPKSLKSAPDRSIKRARRKFEKCAHENNETSQPSKSTVILKSAIKKSDS